jgi:hypothetical protein
MLTPAPPDGYAHLLELPLIAHVAVTAPDGSPRSYPMWFVVDHGRLLFTNTRTRPQTEWLTDRPQFALSIVDPEDVYRYLGVALELEGVTPDPTGALYERLAQRYDVDFRPADPTDRVVIAARPTRYWKQ